MTTLTERTYSTAEACVETDVTPREIHWWLHHGLVTPSIHRGISTGSVHRWSETDLSRLRALKLLRLAGVELGAIRRRGLARLRADVNAALDPAQAAGLD